MVKMPNLVGMTEEDAIAALQLAKLTLGTITPANSASLKAGTIISTDPMVNVSIAEGSIVNLISSNGKVMVPDVTNLDISEAKNKLTAVDVGLTVTVDTFDVCDTTLGTVVQSQSIAPGLTAQRSAIVLYVECLP
jgi:serine/threonine-protein kinase